MKRVDHVVPCRVGYTVLGIIRARLELDVQDLRRIRLDSQLKHDERNDSLPRVIFCLFIAGKDLEIKTL